MLNRILDTTNIDMDNLGIKKVLDSDLIILEKHLEQMGIPENSNVYRAKATPFKTSRPELPILLFEIQYGKIVNGGFHATRDKIYYESEFLRQLK